MKKGKVIGIFSILLGVLLIYNSRFNLLGGVIGVREVSSNLSLFIGLVFVIVGVILFFADKKKKLEDETKLFNFPGDPESYFKRRAKEIYDVNYNHQDVWVSRWEIDGIMDYIKNGKNRKGKLIYSNSDFEHKTDTITYHTYAKENNEEYNHFGGKKVPINIPHLNSQVEVNGEVIKRHIYITDDPNDPRLKYIGIDLNKRKRVNSKVYSQAHPTPKSQVYKRKIKRTYSKPDNESEETKAA